jgi:hypothetical protein
LLTAKTPAPVLDQIADPVIGLVTTPFRIAPLAVSHIIGAPAETIGIGAIDTCMESVRELQIPELPDVAYNFIVPSASSAWDIL